jgi:dTMP kinase
MSGKLMVFEGTDGSGKATQAALMCRYLERRGIPFRKIDFPRYGQPSAVMVQEYLAGNLGKNPGDVNAYAASLFYAVDRYASYKQDWGSFYEGGGLVVADRYTTSNAVHQATKLPEAELGPYLSWLFDLEYRLLGLPEPDLVVYLDLPPEVSGRMLRKREADTGTQADIHERDGAYLARCHRNAQEVARRCGWSVVSCAGAEGLRTPEDIHRQVVELAEKHVL